MKAWEKRAIDALEWERFLRLAAAEAKSEPGNAKVLELMDPTAWAKDVPSADHRQKETAEVLGLLQRQSLWNPLDGLTDPMDALERLGKGATLEINELSSLRKWLYAVDAWVQAPREEMSGDLIRKAVHSLADPLEPLKILDRILTPEGELSERASPRLATLYAEIRALKKEISTVLDHLLKTFSQRGVLQENFTDVRDGRYVIPVKIASQNEVDGIIYEASASRQTVFVEPKEVSPLNNRLRQRQNDLIQEIYAVLTEASVRLRPFAGETAVSVEILSHWDAVQARASFGRHFSGHAIQVTEERKFFLPNTAHPLLWFSLRPEQIIRNHLDFSDPNRTFLLTGPNTGGKTVLLKTLGLAGLCARSGFPFPGSQHLVVPFFDSFFADLGDPQSLEEHLSSFSGHILKFKEILEEVSARSLVLIDELNTATDPEEGAALGRAFLETIMSQDAMIVTTTHDPHLKALAVSDSRILNASMEFDEDSRTPTFLLVPGIPGRSRALETAERLGLPSRVLNLARSYLSKEHNVFENMLSRLEHETQEATRSRKEAVHLREEAERLRREWTERTEKSVGEILDKTRQKLRRILEQAQDEVRSSVAKLDQMRSRREVDQTRSKINEMSSFAEDRISTALREEAPDVAAALAEKASAIAAKPQTDIAAIFKPGSKVRVPRWKTTGVVLSVGKETVKVAMGNLQVTLSPAEIEPLAPSELALLIQTERSAARRAQKDAAPSAPSPSIDLRGERLDEAMARLERYLDQAFRSGAYNEVTIVHGLGTGALREGALQLLRKLPYVKNFRDGGKGAGGTGATIVEF